MTYLRFFFCSVTLSFGLMHSKNVSAQQPEPVLSMSSGNYRPKPAPKPKPIHTELSIGYRINSDGWNFYVDGGNVKSEEGKKSDYLYDIAMFQFEVGEKKDPRQMKIKPSDGTGQSKSFIYGKVNNFYNVKLGYGYRKMIAGKPEPKSVSVHWVNTGGLSAGLLKPYYIEAYVQGSAPGSYYLETIKYSEQNSNSFLNPQYIVGASDFAKGFEELKIFPGIYARSALHFDFAVDKHNVMAIEAGISGEIYTKKIQLMAKDNGKPYFLNVFASFQVGKRW